MAVRTFEAPDGSMWSVWDVVPGKVSDFRSSHGSHLPTALADGWLCFDCGTEKRRLAPLPPEWDARTDEELWFWCRAAIPVRARPGARATCLPAPDELAAEGVPGGAASSSGVHASEDELAPA